VIPPYVTPRECSRHVVVSSCCEHMALPPMASWKAIHPRKVPLCIPPKWDACVSKSFDVYWRLPECFRQPVYIMTPCSHNEFVGLRGRMLKETEHRYSIDQTLVSQILDEIAAMIKFEQCDVTPLSLTVALSNVPSSKLLRYESAINDIYERGCAGPKFAENSAFVKTEIYSEMKCPRIITNVNPEFNLWWSKFIDPLEHAMLTLPFVTKGRNYVERGEAFFDRVYGQAYLEGDCSRAEAHQRSEFISDSEFGLVSRLYTRLEDLFAYKHGLELSAIKIGTTSNGVKFAYKGCVGSGIRSTGFGTTLRVAIAARAFEILNNTGGFYNFVVDGDDNIIKIPFGMNSWIDTFSMCGFDAKLIYRTDYHDVDFCSGKFIQNKLGQFMFVQNIRKLLTNAAVIKKTNFKHVSTHFATLAVMYEKMYPGFPVIRALVQCMKRNTSGVHFSRRIADEMNPSFLHSFDRPAKPFQLDSTVYAEIDLCFGVNYLECKWLEQFFSNCDFGLRRDECKRLRAFRLQGQRIDSSIVDIVDDILEIDMFDPH